MGLYGLDGFLGQGLIFALAFMIMSVMLFMHITVLKNLGTEMERVPNSSESMSLGIWTFLGMPAAVAIVDFFMLRGLVLFAVVLDPLLKDASEEGFNRLMIVCVVVLPVFVVALSVTVFIRDPVGYLRLGVLQRAGLERGGAEVLVCDDDNATHLVIQTTSNWVTLAGTGWIINTKSAVQSYNSNFEKYYMIAPIVRDPHNDRDSDVASGNDTGAGNRTCAFVPTIYAACGLFGSQFRDDHWVQECGWEDPAEDVIIRRTEFGARFDVREREEFPSYHTSRTVLFDFDVESRADVEEFMREFDEDWSTLVYSTWYAWAGGCIFLLMGIGVLMLVEGECGYEEDSNEDVTVVNSQPARRGSVREMTPRASPQPPPPPEPPAAPTPEEPAVEESPIPGVEVYDMETRRTLGASDR